MNLGRGGGGAFTQFLDRKKVTIARPRAPFPPYTTAFIFFCVNLFEEQNLDFRVCVANRCTNNV